MITNTFFTDKDGNPDGGTTFGQGFTIGWQRGSLGRGEARTAPNGAFICDVIEAVKNRLEYFQGTKFANQSNHEAICHLRWP